MSITTPSQPGTGGFLTFNSRPPRLCITSTAPHPPEKTLLLWKEEGFHVTYIPYLPSEQASYIKTIKTFNQNLELGETYGLVAYGDAASVVLKVAEKPLPKCCAIVAFYPPILPSPKHKHPSLLHVAVHTAGLSQMSPDPETCQWKCYTYERCSFGFADPSSEFYSHVEADLAWSRTLAAMRRGFKMDIDIESAAQAMWRAKYSMSSHQGALAVVSAMTSASPHVTIAPTMSGGLGRKKLQEFYSDFFIPSLVEDFTMRLVSRTIGTNRVVDEIIISFTHTDEIDWILPGVPPTNKFVQVLAVSVVGVTGGKLVSEHMYWDQASVLVQVGLLDPKVVPKKMRDNGLKRLPVVSDEGAKMVQNPTHDGYNGLLKLHGLMDDMANGS